MLNMKHFVVVLACGLLMLGGCSKSTGSNHSAFQESTSKTAVSQTVKYSDEQLFSDKVTVETTTNKQVFAMNTKQSETIPNKALASPSKKSTNDSAKNKPISNNKLAKQTKTPAPSMNSNNTYSNETDNYIPYVLIGLLILIVAIFYIRKGK